MARPREGGEHDAAAPASEVSYEVVGSSEYRGHRRRASSITTSPPPPPHDFNPPPDFHSESLLQGITTSLPSSSTASPLLAALASADADDVPRLEGLPGLLSPGACSGEGPMGGNARPQIRALQRLSTESLHRTSISSGSAGSGGSTVRDSGSDGGEILAARRDELVSQLLVHSDTNDSADSSRRPSTTGSSNSSSPQDGPFELNVINPTPPTSMLSLRDEAFGDNVHEGGGGGVGGGGGGGVTRPRSSSIRSVEDGSATVHAWDSVWPVANAMHRVAFPPESGAGDGSVRFPTAPVSPYVTPSFTPTAIAAAAQGLTTSRRLSFSPPRPTSPSLHSPHARATPDPTQTSPQPQLHRPESHDVWRRDAPAAASASERLPTSTNPAGAGRLLSQVRSLPASGTSTPLAGGGVATTPAPEAELAGRSPPHASPPPLPSRLSLLSLESSPVTQLPTGGASGILRARSAVPGSPSLSAVPSPSSRVPALGTSPPISWILGSPNRPRGDTSGLSDQFADASAAPIPITARRDSHRSFTPPLQPGSNPRRRLSETAILRRPQGLAPLESLQPPPSSNQLPAERQSPVAEQPLLDSTPPPDVDREDNTTSLSPGTPVRPGAPRRAWSEQDARAFTPGGQMFNISPIDKSYKRSSPSSTAAQLLTELDSSRPDPRLYRKSPRRSAGDLPPLLAHGLPLDTRMDSAYEAVFEMDEYAVDDENDSDDNDVGGPLAPPKHQLGQEPTQPPYGLSPPGDLEATSARLAAAQSHPSTSVAAALVDEGDVLPANGSQIAEMDVTFDDEGLNTLERIFLLSRSEYAFHRAYVARVLGDLLSDVDPCESVEYVLPLISSFSLDEDDSVKEAFAVDLHRILWYFFSTCHLVKSEDDYGEDAWHRHEGDLEDPPAPPRADAAPLSGIKSTPHAKVDGRHEKPTTPTQPMDVPRPAPDTLDPAFQEALRETSLAPASGSASTRYGTSSTYSTEPPGVQTPATSLSLLSSDDNCGGLPLDVLDVPTSPSPSGDAEVFDKPVLAVDFFRPLLGTLLLSQNPAVADPVRNGIVSIISRLSGSGPLSVETWGANCTQPERTERRTYLSQNGPHAHDFQPFDPEAMTLVEHELLYGIVLGVGTLATDVPDSFFDNSAEDTVILEDGTEVSYNSRDREYFRQQMLHEATLGRALSLSFIGSVCEFYTPENVVAYGFVDEVIRGLDGDATTRAEAALTMSYVAKVVPPEDIDRLLPVFNAFARDDDQQVRQSACVCMPALCKRIQDPTARRDFATSTITVFMESGDEVRSAALEVLGEVIYAFSDDPLGPPPRLLEVYLDDREATGEDSGWDMLASYNFPGVCLTLGPDRWSELRGLFLRLVSRAGDRVLRTVAAFLHELAQILRPGQVAEDILPVYRRCLQCCDEIRERIFEHVDLILKHVEPHIGWQSFSDLVDAWSNDTLGGWRAREQLALHFPAFFETFNSRDQVAVVLDMMRKALRDPFAAVRDAATFAVPLSYETLRSDDAAEHGSALKFHDMLLDLAFSDRFRHRVTFVRCLREFERPPPNKPAFEKFFVPALPRLCQDVVDVRLGLAQCVSDLFVLGAFYGDRKVPVPDIVRQLAAQLAEDDSSDVRDTITRVGADKWIVEASAPAAMELAITEDPVGVSPAVHEALRERREASELYEEQEAGGGDRHDRAALPSPMPDQQGDWTALRSPDDDELGELDRSQMITKDPFAASFGRATKE